MPFEEYKDYAKELNKPIEEFKRIKALPNNNIKEMAPLPPESVQVPERSSDIDPTPEIEKMDLDSQDIGNKQDRFDEVDNKADAGKRTSQGQSDNNNRINNTINNDNTTINSGLETAEAATETSVVSSSAVLTSGVTVISACVAVAVVGVGASIMNKAPTIVSGRVEAGADYLVYELDVRDLDYSNDNADNKTEYKIRVHNDTFVMDFPIEKEGMQRQIVTGLIPFRTYTVSVVGHSDLIGDVNYYNIYARTSKLKKPKAVFNFMPKIDYQAGLFNVEYEAYVSDYYNTGSDTYLKIYANDSLIVEDSNLPEDGFFKGVLTNMANGVKISAEVYTTYYDEVDTLIGEYGYVVEHPEDFIKNEFLSEYTFNEDSIDSAFDANELEYTLDINTDFNNEGNPNESYRIDLYNYGELIESVTTTDKNVSFKLPSYINNVDVKLTEIMGNAEIGTKTIPYVMNPKLFNTEFRFTDVASSTNGASYYIEASPNEEVLMPNINGQGGGKINFINDAITSYDDLNFKLTEYDESGSHIVSESTAGFTGELLGIEDDFLYLLLEITSGDRLIGRYKYEKPDCEININNIEIDDYGNVSLPYEIDSKGYKFNYLITSFDSANTDSLDINGDTGKIEFDHLGTNVISGYVTLGGYDKSGSQTEVHIPINDINLNARINTESYVSYSSSQLWGELKLETVVDIDGETRPINIDLGIEQWAYDHYDDALEESVYDYHTYSTENHTSGMFYTFNPISVYADGDITSMYYKYKITAPGFEETNIDNEIQLDFTIAELLALKNQEIYSYSFDSKDISDTKKLVPYVKTVNDDGTVNYYFYTGFIDNNNTHSYRFIYTYEKEGNKRTEYSDYLTDKYVKFENVEDLDYTFEFKAFYEKENVQYEIGEYQTKLLDEENAVNYDKSKAYITGETNTLIIASYDGDAVDKDSVSVIYKNFEFNVPYYTEDNGEIETSPLTEWSKTVGYSYTLEKEITVDGITYNYFMDVSVYNYGYITASITIYDFYDHITADDLPKIKFNVLPSIINKIGANNIKNSSQLNKGQKTLSLFDYSVVTSDDYNGYATADEYGVRLEYNFDSQIFKYSDEDIMIYILDENRQLINKAYSQYGSIYTFASPTYKKLIVQTVLVKRMDTSDSSTYVEYYVIDEKEYDVEDLYSVSSVPLDIISNNNSNVSGNDFTYTANINDSSDNYLNGNYVYNVYAYSYSKNYPDEEKEVPDAEGEIIDLSNVELNFALSVDDADRVEIVITKKSAYDDTETVWYKEVIAFS